MKIISHDPVTSAVNFIDLIKLLQSFLTALNDQNTVFPQTETAAQSAALCDHRHYVCRPFTDWSCLLELTYQQAAILDGSHMWPQCIYFY